MTDKCGNCFYGRTRDGKLQCHGTLPVSPAVGAGGDLWPPVDDTDWCGLWSTAGTAALPAAGGSPAVTGPAGPTGATGATGVAGATGATGATGAGFAAAPSGLTRPSSVFYKDVTFTPGAITALTGTVVTTSVTGLLTTDGVVVSCIQTMTAGANIANVRVSASDTLEITFTTAVAAGITLGSLTFRVFVYR